MRRPVVIIVSVIIFAGVILLINIFSPHGYQRISTLESQVSRLQKERTTLQKQVNELELEIEALKKGGKYQQRVIREELGYIKENEVIINVENKDD